MNSAVDQHEANPYAAPLIRADSGDSLRTDLPAFPSNEARRKLAIPAYCLIATGWLWFAMLPVTVAAVCLTNEQQPSYFGEPLDGLLFVLLEVICAALTLLIVRGGLAMLQLRNHAAARLGAIVALASGGGPLALGLPFAIWAFVLLRNEQIRKAFGAGRIHWFQFRVESDRAVK